MASDRDTQASYRDALACMLTTDPFESPRYREFAAADRVIAAGWRPRARVITTAAELAELATTWPCVIREQPADPTDFYPAMWEMGFQVGWCRAGQAYDPDDCTPTLPVTVLVVPTEEADRG